MSEKSRPSIFWGLAVLVVPFSWLCVRFHIRNRERLPATGPYVLAPNHYSEIDPIMTGLVAWKLGRAPRFLAKASLFRVPVLGWLLRHTGQVPVERSGAARGAEPLRAAQALVERGRAVIVYPEGSLTRDPELWPMRGHTGAARIALQQGIPVIPLAHWGVQGIMGRYSKRIHFFPPKRVDVAIGHPVDLSAFEGRPLDSETLRGATAAIMSDITGLLEEIRGEQAPTNRWDPKAHDQKETGRFEP